VVQLVRRKKIPSKITIAYENRKYIIRSGRLRLSYRTSERMIKELVDDNNVLEKSEKELLELRLLSACYKAKENRLPVDLEEEPLWLLK